jgi:phenol 2-monooxygenase
VLPNDGRFNLVVFTGKTYLTGPSLVALGKALDASLLSSSSSSSSSDKVHSVVTMTTVILGEAAGAAEVMGCDPFGTGYLDTTRRAHDAYGIDDAKGAVLLLRPDGYLALAMDISTAAGDLSEYFARLLVG